MNNEKIVERMILFKQQDERPYNSTGTSTVTDMDVFPYPRFYRNNYNSEKCFTFEREAGWKPRRDDCYQIASGIKRELFYPNNCFQAPPSTQYPCYPEYLRKYSDKKELEQQLNRTNVNEYR